MDKESEWKRKILTELLTEKKGIKSYNVDPVVERHYSAEVKLSGHGQKYLIEPLSETINKNSDKVSSSKQRRLRKKRAHAKTCDKPVSVTLPNLCTKLDVKQKPHKLLRNSCSGTEDKSVDLHTLSTCAEQPAKINSAFVFETVNMEKQKTGKSRDEIQAERETKKLAKQMAKSKKVTVAVSTPPETKLEQRPTLEVNVQPQAKSTVVKQSSTQISSKIVQGGEVKADLLPSPVPKQVIVYGKMSATSAVQQVADQMKSLAVDQQVEKGKAELRAERRAKQEAQRAAKAAGTVGNKTVKVDAKVTNTQQPQLKTKPILAQSNGAKSLLTTLPKANRKPTANTMLHKVKLFNHLYAEREDAAHHVNMNLNSGILHPAIVKLGVQYANGIVVGSNARCIAFIDALKKVISDYVTPPQKEFSRGLESSLQPCMTYLHLCRPVSVSMTNALRFVKRQITQIPTNMSDKAAKTKLCEAIDTYYDEQIDTAAKAISNTMQNKIVQGDVIMTYGCSSLIQLILEDAHRKGIAFHVVVVDGRPLCEGRELLRRLVSHGISCSYVLVTATSFIMGEVSKVLLGAHALLANGYVMSRVGTAQVAAVANSYNVPVLVCCETHKFIERVQTDSFVYNEIGDPDELINHPNSQNANMPLSQWQKLPYLTPLYLKYDVTPPELVTAVVTELAILPCTSVPVILRIKPSEIGC